MDAPGSPLTATVFMPTFYPEGNTSVPTDGELKVAQKILGILNNTMSSSGTAITVEVANPTTTNVPSSLERTTLGYALAVHTSACVLYQVDVCNNNTHDRYLQIHDAASIPAEGSVPKRVFPLFQATGFTLPFNEGLKCIHGCMIVVSSTLATLTSATTENNYMIGATFSNL
jgi:hypothetical protein